MCGQGFFFVPVPVCVPVPEFPCLAHRARARTRARARLLVQEQLFVIVKKYYFCYTIETHVIVNNV
jgi:hypothetical protein